MPIVKIQALRIKVDSKEAADKFLRALDVILSLYEQPQERGSYEYSLEILESGMNAPKEPQSVQSAAK
jgi:hypothetical protein